jgi:hypothetical protein
VYVNPVAVELPAFIVIELGEKVPPLPPSDGVIIVVAPRLADGVITKLPEVAETAPEVGPLNASETLLTTT